MFKSESGSFFVKSTRKFPLVAFLLFAAITSILTPTVAGAETTVHPLNGGQPVLVRVIEPAADLNHRDYFGPLRAKKSPIAIPQGMAIPPQLQFPLRRGISNTHPGVHSISNFVDLDGNHPDSLLDYACGERTYDTDTFDHNGIDINSSMFPWLTMANDGLVVIAAADGIIVERHDGEPDQQCAFDDSADANLIVLEHDDGSITIYAHMKNGTVTARKVGDRVEAGDYLGVAGSSGLSTGPHLHLGTHDSAGDLIEPHAGACNDLNPDSWWGEQEDYHVKTINAVRTHSAFPETPPCPQLEVPHFADEFDAADTIFMSAFVRDIVMGDVIDFEVRGPSDQVVFQASYEQEDFDHAGAFFVVFGAPFRNPPAGTYRLIVTYSGSTSEHTFYINSSPDPLPSAVVGNNAYNGLWYDPSLDGEGYNIITADVGTIIYFYGSDSKGNRVWLVSDLLYGPIGSGVPIEIKMYESTGGVFGSPVISSRGLSHWGEVIFIFTGCEAGQATLRGVDGDKVSQIVKLIGVAGTSCTAGDVLPDSSWSGLWFDPGKDGEGYNMLVTPVGRLLYYYGFKGSGLRLWLVSDLITEELEMGKDVVVDLFEATQGVFSTPVTSSEALVIWGTATITLVDCSHITIVITGSDGSKTSNTVRLAGIIGLICS